MVPGSGARGAVADSAFAGIGRDSFEFLLYRSVRRSMPWVLSAAIHVAVAFAATALSRESAAPAPLDGKLALASIVPVATELESDSAGEEVLGPPSPGEPPPSPDLPLTAEETRLGSHEAEEAPPPQVSRPGILPSTISVGGRRRPAPKRPEPVKPPSALLEDNTPFEASGAEAANREASGILRRGLEGGKGDGALLRRLDPRRIHVCEGCYDRVEEVLELLEIRHDTLTLGEIASAPLGPGDLLVIDCGADGVEADAADAIREFVEMGGYLCTTDWGLENVLERAFPGVLRSLYRGGRGVATEDLVVPFRIVARDHPLVRGMAPISEGALWWIENQAHPILVVDSAKAVVLAESAVLKARYGSGVLAVTFPWGKGKVLHLLGHAWQKEGNLKGTYGIQRLIVNFLLDRAGTAPAPAPATKER